MSKPIDEKMLRRQREIHAKQWCCATCAISAGGNWKPDLNVAVRRGTCLICSVAGVVLLPAEKFSFGKGRAS